MKKIIIFFAFIFLLSEICLTVQAKPTSKLEITSSAFESKSFIPLQNACNILGSDKSPPLTFARIPSGTKSLALILDDPDAPGGAFNHWIIFNIPPSNGRLNEGIPKEGEVGDSMKQGTNSTNQIGYFGPCPPPKETHRYVFKVFALDVVLDLKAGANKKQLLSAMKKHILGKGRLVGLFKNNTNL